MPEFGVTLNSNSDYEDDDSTSTLSLYTADEFKGNSKVTPKTNMPKVTPKTNMPKVTPKTNNNAKRRAQEKPPMKTARATKKLTKRNPQKKKKLNKKVDKLENPNCEPCDCDAVGKEKSASPDKDERNASPNKDTETSGSKMSPKRSLNQRDPNVFNLLLDLLECVAHEDLGTCCRENKVENLRRWFQNNRSNECKEYEIENLRRWFQCTLNERFNCQSPIPCYLQSCNPWCSPICPTTTCGDQPTLNFWDDVVQTAQPILCEPCCTTVYPGCCATSTACYCPCQELGTSKCVLTNYPTCCTQASPERSRCCCIKKSPSCRSKSSRRKTPKISVPDPDVKFKSRMWLLEENEKLERELVKLRKKVKVCKRSLCCSPEECITCMCMCVPEQQEQCILCVPEQQEREVGSRGHASTQLWDFLMESSLKALIGSNPDVRELDNEPPKVDFVLPGQEILE